MASEDNRARRWLTLLGIPLLAFLVLGAWSFASPVGSSPDDDFHLPSIWCGQGERPGLCEAIDDGPARMVPIPIVNSTCYAFHPETDAGCWDPTTEGLTRVERANIDGLYPPLFYSVMSVFAGPDVQFSVIAIRLVNSAFAVGMLTAVVLALPRRIRPAVLVSVLAASVPLGVFIFASTNPSSWTLLSAVTVWSTLFGATQSTGRRRWALSALALFGAVLGAGARADAAIFAVYGAAMALLLGLRGLRNLRDQRIPLVTAGLIVITSVAFYFSARQGGAAFGGLDPASTPLTLAQHVSNFLEVPSLWTGALGQSNLGWFDTRMPAAVWVLTTAVFGGALFVGLAATWRRRIVAVVLSLLAMWLVPFVMLAQSNAVVGATVQPRYLLPLLIIALGVASLRFDAEEAWNGVRYWLAGAALWAGLTIALHQNIGRYTSGSEGDSIDPGAAGSWWWSGVPAPLATWVTGSLAFAGVLALLWFAKRRPAPAPAATIDPAFAEEPSRATISG